MGDADLACDVPGSPPALRRGTDPEVPEGFAGWRWDVPSTEEARGGAGRDIVVAGERGWRGSMLLYIPR